MLPFLCCREASLVGGHGETETVIPYQKGYWQSLCSRFEELCPWERCPACRVGTLITYQADFDPEPRPLHRLLEVLTSIPPHCQEWLLAITAPVQSVVRLCNLQLYMTSVDVIIESAYKIYGRTVRDEYQMFFFQSPGDLVGNIYVAKIH